MIQATTATSTSGKACSATTPLRSACGHARHGRGLPRPRRRREPVEINSAATSRESLSLHPLEAVAGRGCCGARKVRDSGRWPARYNLPPSVHTSSSPALRAALHPQALGDTGRLKVPFFHNTTTRRVLFTTPAIFQPRPIGWCDLHPRVHTAAPQGAEEHAEPRNRPPRIRGMIDARDPLDRGEEPPRRRTAPSQQLESS